jgi:hypothetical protein
MPFKLKMRVSFALGAAAVAVLAAVPLSCGKAEPTGYLLVIRTPPPREEIPSSISIRCLKSGGTCINDLSYPDAEKNPGVKLAYKEGNVLARVALDIEGDFETPRKLWVRARLGFTTLGEYAARLPNVVDGKQQTIEVMLQWGRLPDRDRDEVPDAIDDCPDRSDQDQNGDCGSGVNPDTGVPEPLDAAVMIDTRPAVDAGSDARVVDANKG